MFCHSAQLSRTSSDIGCSAVSKHPTLMLVAKFYRRLLILACLQTHQESNGTCNAVSNNAMSSLVEIVYRLAAGARNLLFVKRLRKACSEPHFEVPLFSLVLPGSFSTKIRMSYSESRVLPLNFYCLCEFLRLSAPPQPDSRVSR